MTKQSLVHVHDALVRTRQDIQNYNSSLQLSSNFDFSTVMDAQIEQMLAAQGLGRGAVSEHVPDT